MLFELYYVISNTRPEGLSKTSNMATAHKEAERLCNSIDNLLVKLLEKPELRNKTHKLLHDHKPDIEASARTYVWAMDNGEAYSIEALAAYLYLNSYREYRD